KLTRKKTTAAGFVCRSRDPRPDSRSTDAPQSDGLSARISGAAVAAGLHRFAIGVESARTSVVRHFVLARLRLADVYGIAVGNLRLADDPIGGAQRAARDARKIGSGRVRP